LEEFAVRLNRMLVTLAVLAAIAASAAGLRSRAEAAAPTFTEAPCDGKAIIPPGFDPTRIRCGFVLVPENRDRSDSRMIEIWASVISATSPRPQPDPVLFLQGGPGQSGVDFSIFTSEWYTDSNADRDFVSFDFRGTGFSAPLRCNEYDRVLGDSLKEKLTPEQEDARYEEAIAACHARYLADGVDLTQYDSATIVEDMVDLMTALGYDEWNLIGGSYGTRLALTAMRDAPRHIRSAVLDAAVPVGASVDIERVSYFETKLDKLWKECAADADCGTAYPGIEQTFWDLIDRANAHPIPVTITTPDGVTADITIDGNEILAGTWQAMTDTASIPLIPFAIDDIARGNTGVLSQVASQLYFVDYGIATGMFWTVQCNEEWPFYRDAHTVAAARGVREVVRSEIGWSPEDVANQTQFCKEWNDPHPDPRENHDVSSSIPTVLLAGEFDTNTPTEFAQRAARLLSNSYVIEVPSSGHFTTYPQQDCTNPLIAAFFADPGKRPDTSCIDAIPPVDFAVAETAASPTPPQPAATPTRPAGVIRGPDTGTGPGQGRAAIPSYAIALAIAGAASCAAGLASRQRRPQSRRSL